MLEAAAFARQQRIISIQRHQQQYLRCIFVSIFSHIQLEQPRRFKINSSSTQRQLQQHPCSSMSSTCASSFAIRQQRCTSTLAFKSRALAAAACMSTCASPAAI